MPKQNVMPGLAATRAERGWAIVPRDQIAQITTEPEKTGRFLWLRKQIRALGLTHMPDTKPTDSDFRVNVQKLVALVGFLALLFGMWRYSVSVYVEAAKAEQKAEDQHKTDIENADRIAKENKDKQDAQDKEIRLLKEKLGLK